MDKKLSEKIKVISFVLILLVLYIHSGFHLDEIAGMGINFYVQRALGKMLGRCAVPLFYVISGYLFYFTAKNIQSVFDKMKKRFKSLVIPYLIGCLFFVSVFFILRYVPGVSQFMNSNLSEFFKESPKVMLYKTFINSGSGTPLAFHLWFLRDLILLVLTAPIWYFAFKYLRWYWVPLVAILAFYFSKTPQVYALFWFALGGALPLTTFKVLDRSSSVRKIIVILLFLILCIVQLCTITWVGWLSLKIPIIFIGVMAIWYAYDVLVPDDFNLESHRYLVYATSFTFFIYLFHEPSLNVVRKIIVFLIGKNSLGYLISYLLSPWLFFFTGTIVGLIFKKILPRAYGYAAGGR
ncbi:acyltransferase [Polaribacter sp. Asnod1-A03]|uniref:acyltransferase family protein n=1 Tax=Polaribacter sp. Asnod1-A03 TaxID=3160581 RepID=UPI00386DBD74